MGGSPVTARACANIALVKYWGKRDARLNLPAAGSLSVTLDALTTTTTVTFDPALAQDELTLDGAPAPTARLTPVLDLVRAQAQITTRASVDSANQFPTSSGLASSASGFAALAVAASRAAGLSLRPIELSILARRGSGSAARSIHGGFVRMRPGVYDDGSDAFAEPLPVTGGMATRVRMVIAVVGGGAKKATSSRDAMEHCAATSPLYAGWLATVPRDLASAEAAIDTGDLQRLGEVAEASAMAMHAAAMASRPAVIYWQPPTLAALARVRELRAAGTPAWATIDAGPHVKVLTERGTADQVAAAMQQVPGVTQVIVSGVGGPVAVVEPPPS
jgi:diphosphomevalonate decarboxylase